MEEEGEEEEEEGFDVMLISLLRPSRPRDLSLGIAKTESHNGVKEEEGLEVEEEGKKVQYEDEKEGGMGLTSRVQMVGNMRYGWVFRIDSRLDTIKEPRELFCLDGE